MNDRLHRTDTLGPGKDVCVGPQQERWIEFVLLDEQGNPLPNIPYFAENAATREKCAPAITGNSDANGRIRIEGLHPIALTLRLGADPLAKELQTRRLRALRAEQLVPPLPPYLYEPPPVGFSDIEKQARADGHAYHYLRIGQLCDRFPGELEWEGEELPAFHFPDPKFSGFTVDDQSLNRRHVLEICPFRAWKLVLHHQADYSLVTAYNLGLMANLSYSNIVQETKKKFPNAVIDATTLRGSVEEFFFRQCLDLSRTPVMIDAKGYRLPAVVVDVPFDERYTTAVMLDTTADDLDRASADIPRMVIENTQLFYFSNTKEVVVAWRGTQEPSDWLTDFQYRPQPADGSETKSEAENQGIRLAAEGNVHKGFLKAFEVAKKLFPERFIDLDGLIVGKRLFICGHSLGGALALIHSAELRQRNPVLSTYGMPRTFTKKAVEDLQQVIHFRHVNNADTITSVPPEAELDNILYDALGPLGDDLGYIWSVPELLASKIFRFGDPYWHHGKLAMNYRADLHAAERYSGSAARGSKDGLGAPRHTQVLKPLSPSNFIFVVPSLAEGDSSKAEAAQKELMKSLTVDSLAEYFPKHTNPDRSTKGTNPMDHSMIGKYLPFLHNSLLELCSPQHTPERIALRARFNETLTDKRIPGAERVRTQAFLNLEKLLPMVALPVTQQLEGGAEALQRFGREREFAELVEIIPQRQYGSVSGASHKDAEPQETS
ncbi:MAG: Pdl protein [Pseudomonas sp.]|uniref:lipase family protein n=1 Tax=Pseudomonas sp. TaxID=306 RepID=UPI000CCA06A1|nr:lipase family protein [Pseudomonas sp.]PJI50421.1 MAG: Pdl protein [Pseudomonas sp.]